MKTENWLLFPKEWLFGDSELELEVVALAEVRNSGNWQIGCQCGVGVTVILLLVFEEWLMIEAAEE